MTLSSFLKTIIIIQKIEVHMSQLELLVSESIPATKCFNNWIMLIKPIPYAWPLGWRPNCKSVIVKSSQTIVWSSSYCNLPSEAEYLRDLPLEVSVAPGAPPQPRVELGRPVRAAGPVTPQDDRVPPDVQVAEVLPWGYKLFKINIQLKNNEIFSTCVGEQQNCAAGNPLSDHLKAHI